MRTTLELPDDLMKRAKIAAVERGTTLGDLMGRALARELAEPHEAPVPPRRAAFPVFSPKRSGSPLLTAEAIRRDEEAEDLRLSGLHS